MSGEKSVKTLSAFEYIREINKLSSDILSPAKFKILVEIAIQAAENGNVLAKNKELSIKTGIKPNSVKVLMSQMKKDGFIFEQLDQIRAIESTKLKATSNPETYINRILDNDCKGIKLADTKPVKTAYDIAREQDEKNRQRMGPNDDTCLSVAEMRAIRTTNYAARKGA